MSRSRRPKCRNGRKRCGCCADSKQIGRRRRAALVGLEDSRQLRSKSTRFPRSAGCGCGMCEMEAMRHSATLYRKEHRP